MIDRSASAEALRIIATSPWPYRSLEELTARWGLTPAEVEMASSLVRSTGHDLENVVALVVSLRDRARISPDSARSWLSGIPASRIEVYPETIRRMANAAERSTIHA